MIVDTDDILDLFGISDKDIYAKETIDDAIYDGILHQVEPERKKGKWKPDESGNVYWICSACGFASEAFGANILYHFCPNCGADMREEGGET